MFVLLTTALWLFTMNQFQADLYRDLMALTTNNEAFYFQDFPSEAGTLRIFNYRLASYTDFLAPGALEARGVMFLVNESGVEMLSLPMSKFHNLNECPFTQNLDLAQVEEIYDKLDGSLISTYMLGDRLMLKSKGSVSSDQALDAMAWLNDRPAFYEALRDATVNGFTVNLEWIGPGNRVVIGYAETSLKVLNARSRLDGSYVPYEDVVDAFDVRNVVARREVADPVAFVMSVPDMQDDIEGFVVKLSSGLRFKIKTLKYLSLHHAKDSVNNPRRLFEAILEEGIDDLRSMFYTDQVAMMMIDQMQKKVDHIFNGMVRECEAFYNTNKHLDRKDYAIKGKEEVNPMFFSRVMNLYLKKEPDWKNFIKGKWKDLGFKDEALSSTGE